MDTLIDTSVWIDFFNNANNPQVEHLEKLLIKGEACTCPIVVMEVLQGIRSDSTCRKTETLMTSLGQYPVEDDRYRDAAMLYRSLRAKGLTIRKSLDCLIAAVAIHNQLPVLHKDRDFSAIARHTGLVSALVIPEQLKH